MLNSRKKKNAPQTGIFKRKRIIEIKDYIREKEGIYLNCIF